MKISNSVKAKFYVWATLGISFVLFQNFSLQQSREFVEAKEKLENIKIPSLYSGCENAGSASDRRPASTQFKCHELPFGKIIGMSPSEHAKVMAANPQIPRPSSCWGFRTMFQSECQAYMKSEGARKHADEQLALWHARKEIFNQDIPFTDKVGQNRSIRFVAHVDRGAIESNAAVTVGNAEVGIRDYGTQKIFKPQGHHFYNLNKDKYTISGCTYFPGITLSGERMGSEYTIWKKWYGSYSINFSINPGQFKYDRFETCNLFKINTDGHDKGAVSVIGVKAPRFIGAQVSGLHFDIDIGFFGWFMTTILAAVLSFIPIVGNFLSVALVSAVFLITETKIPSEIAQKYINKNLNSYDTTESWNRMLNNINMSEANIKSGDYLRDITAIAKIRNAVLPALQEQMQSHSKVEQLRLINASAAEKLESAYAKFQTAKNDLEVLKLELKNRARAESAVAKAEALARINLATLEQIENARIYVNQVKDQVRALEMKLQDAQAKISQSASGLSGIINLAEHTNEMNSLRADFEKVKQLVAAAETRISQARPSIPNFRNTNTRFRGVAGFN